MSRDKYKQDLTLRVVLDVEQEDGRPIVDIRAIINDCIRDWQQEVERQAAVYHNLDADATIVVKP